MFTDSIPWHNAYYRYCQRCRPPDLERQALPAAVKDHCPGHSDRYGSRRMRRALNALGYPIGCRQGRSLMREVGLNMRYRKHYKVATHSDPALPVFAHVLARNFALEKPNP